MYMLYCLFYRHVPDHADQGRTPQSPQYTGPDSVNESVIKYKEPSQEPRAKANNKSNNKNNKNNKYNKNRNNSIITSRTCQHTDGHTCQHYRHSP